MRIIVVDDAPEMRKLWRRFLEREVGFEVVGEASNGAEAVALTEELQPDVVIMDATMPVMNGAEATRRIKEISSGIHVIGVTGTSGAAMLEAGATEILMKGAAHGEIPAALRRLHDGAAGQAGGERASTISSPPRYSHGE